jgi:septum formation protein
MRFVLASASPARLATLRAAGVEPEVIVSGVDEDSIRATTVARLVSALAEVKARAVAARITGDALVLGCDSLLELDGAPLGKPARAEEAVERWREMSGRTAILHTGHALLRIVDGEIMDEVIADAATTVRFASISDDEIETYVSTKEPLAVAGAFTIDGLGGWFVESVEGDHHNVVGLSLPLLRRLLIQLNLGLSDLGYPASSGGS